MKVKHKPKLPITKPGVYSGISLDEYHSDVVMADGSFAVSSSNLRTAWKHSMAHMFAEWAHNPKREATKETKWMRFGRTAHHLFLGEDDFKNQFVMEPATYRDKKTAAELPWHNGAHFCKAWHAEMAAAGRTVLKREEIEKVEPMVASLRLNPLVAAGGLNGLVEHSIIVQDKETGLWIKVRPDVIPNDGEYVDLKITSDVNDLAVMSSIGSFGYHMQGGLIWEACEQLEMLFKSFTLLMVEDSAPFCVREVPVHDDDLSRGRLQCRAMMRRVARCIDAGHWPGPGEGELRPLPLAKREREAIDVRLQMEDQRSNGNG